MMPRARAAFTALILWLLLAASSAAQVAPTPARAGANPQAAATAIVGTIADSANQPLAGAAITIRSAKGAPILTGTLTDESGKFRIDGLAPGTYHVHISFIGYQVDEREVAITPTALSANVGTVRLAMTAIAVEGVSAEAVRSAVTVGVDRTIYSTKNMPAASGGSTTDLLRNVPELDVDIDGNVKLQGSQSVALHVNGRPAPMRGEALRNFLQSLPATRVDRVEIVPNPSARYDPDGIAGIVNIVMKDNVDLGTSGSFGLNADSRGRHGANVSLNRQKGRLTLFGNTALHINSNSMKMTDLRENLLVDPRTFFRMSADNEMSGNFKWFDGSAEYKLGKLETAYAAARVNDSSNELAGLQQFAILNAALDPLSRYNHDNNNEFSWGNSDLSLGVRRIVKPMQNELSFELRRNVNHQGNDQRYIKHFLTPAGELMIGLTELGFTDTDTDLTEYSLKADYTRVINPLWKVEAGYKGALRGTEYGNELDRFMEDAPAPFSTQRSNYEYSEDYQQGYATVSRQLGKYGVQLGARGELANTSFDLPTGESFANDYNSLFPSLNVSYAGAAGFSARFAFSRRVERPQPNMLNPSVPSADSMNKFVGNPGLKPKYTNSFTMDFTRTGAWGMMKLAPYYRKTTDNWEYFKVVDDQGIATLTWQNTSSVTAYGTNATLSLRKGATANGFLSFNAYRYERDASNLSAAYSGDGFRWDVSANGMMTVRKGTMVQGFARYQAPQDMPQGRISSSVFSNLGLRHQLIDKKANLNLSVVDPFDVFRFKFETTDATHVQRSQNRVSVRSLRVGVTYSFGKPPQPVRRPDDQQQQQPDQTPQIR